MQTSLPSSPPGDPSSLSDKSGLPRSVVIVGGGIIGLATGWQLCRRGVSVTVVEKEQRVGAHQSSHNSGVLHAGLYYRPGSLKAKLAVEGIRSMRAFCEEHGIAHEICGKLVVATEPDEIPRLKALLERGTENGLRNLRWLEGKAIREHEPHVAGIAAIHVPEEGIVDYQAVCDRLALEIASYGGEVITGAEARAIYRTNGKWTVETTQGSYSAAYLINATGLHCDRICRMAGETPSATIIPFRGEYFKLRPSSQHLVRNLIYPVPDPQFPFLGVHFTRMIQGGVEAGPNAILALAREGYRKTTVNPRDLMESLTFPGLWKFLNAHRSMCTYELIRSLSKKQFCRALQRLVPAITTDDLEPGGAGVRAQAMDPDGTLLQDFRFAHAPHALHILNAPSPGATASLAIGSAVIDEITQTPSTIVS